jgi:O-antigen/teichoic acid export membrane protein
VLLFVLFFAEWILSFFGESFQSGALVLRILAIGQFGNVICGSVSMLLAMTGHAKALQRIVWATALMNIGLSVVLVQGMGALGVAIATAISVFTWNIWAFLTARKKLGFWTIMRV